MKEFSVHYSAKLIEALKKSLRRDAPGSDASGPGGEHYGPVTALRAEEKEDGNHP
jgi:hypothetical protein